MKTYQFPWLAGAWFAAPLIIVLFRPLIDARAEDPTSPTTQLLGVKEVVAGLLARCDACFSGRMVYRIQAGLASTGQVFQDAEFQLSFFGDSWAKRSPSGGTQVSHGGKFVEYAIHPQKDGSTQYTASITLPRPIGNRLPSPPVFAGTVWHRSTKEFIKANTGRARLVEPAEKVNGIDIQIVEWNVPASETKAFHSVGATERLKAPGVLRLYVAPQYGFALARIEHLFGKNFSVKDAIYDASDFYQVAPGLFLPKKCSYQSFSKNGQAGYYIRYDILRTEKINEVISEEDFIVALPNGTLVTDARSAKNPLSFRVSPINTVPAGLQDIVTPLEKGSFYRSRLFAVLVGTVVGLSLVFLYWLVQRRAASRHGCS